MFNIPRFYAIASGRARGSSDTAVHKNVMGLRREDAGGQGNHNEGQNNDQDHRQAIPIAADGDEGNHNDQDLHQAIPIAERVFGRLPTPATFVAQLYGPYPPRR